jgi:ketosteroid isomerase-like protein
MPERDLEAFRRGLRAYSDGDLEELLAVCDEDIEFFPLRSVIEGSYRGHAGIRKWWADTAENWETFRIEAEEVCDLGDGRLVAAGVIHAKGKGGGVPLDIPTSWLTEMDAGRARKVKFFFDRDEAFRAVGVERGDSLSP